MKKNTKLSIINTLFNPNKKGVSEWKTIDEIINGGLKWSNNGNFRHGVAFGCKYYIWEKYPLMGKVEKLRMNGFNKNIECLQNNRPISKKIRDHYKKTPCVVCGQKNNLVLDHKNDLYNNPRVLDIKTQTIDDFQPLCQHCNLQKRTVAKKTRKNGKRYSALNIPSLKIFNIKFTKGCKTFDPNDVNAMVGTYWYDPVDFIKKANESFINENTLSSVTDKIKTLDV